MNSARKTIFSNRGSLAVETAIFLPLLLIGLLTLGYIIKLVSIEERVFHSFADETHALAAKGHLALADIYYSRGLEERILKENKSSVSSAKVEPLMFMVPYLSPKSGRSYNSLIAVSIVYEADIPILPIFKRSVTMSDTILCRSFTGKNNQGDKMPFSEMEESKESDIVWIFPRAGEKYHDKDCGYIKNNYRELLLSSSIKSSYNPCEHCKPESASYGTLVYCFPNTGEAYHLGSCFVVDRFVTPISEDSAKASNYTACSKCGG